MRAMRMVVMLGVVLVLGCTYQGDDGVSKLSPEDRALVVRFGFPQWHALEKAHYGRGQEHAVVVMASLASGQSIEEVLRVQASITQEQGDFARAMLALGILLSDESPSNAAKMRQRISPDPTGVSRAKIHHRVAACLSTGAMITGRTTEQATKLFRSIRSEKAYSERELGYLALAAMLSGKSPAKIVKIFDGLLAQVSHNGSSAILTLGVATSGVSIETIHREWEVLGDQELCGPIDAALLVAGGHFAESLARTRAEKKQKAKDSAAPALEEHQDGGPG